MIKHYIKIAWRSLRKNKSFSIINIFGLTVGFTVFFLIALFVWDELQYDRYNEHANRIYRINTDIKINGSSFFSHDTPAPMASTLIKDYPAIEKVVRIKGGGGALVKKGDQTFMEQHAFFADSNLFDVFTLALLNGNPKTALSRPNTMVISASMAKKYFNSLDVVGRTLKIDNMDIYEITGVIQDVPSASHIHFNFIKSMSSLAASRSDFWLSNSFDTYVLLRKGFPEETLDSYLNETAKKYAEPQLLSVVQSSFSDLAKRGDHFRYTSIPLTKIHLYSKIPSEIEPTGNIQYVYIFSIIGLFILLVACVNFMNLSTARSANRSKEVGVRKVIGSSRMNLIKQFLAESILTSLVAFILAVFLSLLLVPYLNQLAGKAISIRAASTLFITFTPLSLVTGLLAGSYPAFFLSGFQPIQTLKGKVATGFKGGLLRNALVVFQFATAVILFVGTLIIYRQMDFIQHKDVGYTREQVLVIKNAYSLGKYAQTFKEEALRIPGVLAASRSEVLPTSSSNDWNKNAYATDATLSAEHSLTFTDWLVDADYIPALHIQLSKGRNFSTEMATDSNAVIINETAERALGLKDPINAQLYGFNGQTKQVESFRIIGVVKDFNAGSLRYQTEPMILRLSASYGNLFSFRIRGENMAHTVKQIESIYHSFNEMADQPFAFSFLDDEFNQLYHDEQRTGKVFTAFAMLAICIACLGLFGLASYAAEQRTKEIGIRKVLGASVQGLVGLLSKDFIRLVFVAIVIASPLAWWVMNKWLEDFAYRIEISWWVFALAGAAAVMIALLTVSYQAIKAALANPVKSLRNE